MNDNERQAGMKRLSRGFMKPEIVRSDRAVTWDTSREGIVVDLDGYGGDVSREAKRGAYGRIYGSERAPGYFARLSAPGYMDCTDYSGPFTTEHEAEEHLVETYGDDGDGGDEHEAGA